MHAIRYTIHLYGRNFIPSNLMERLHTEYEMICMSEPTEKNKYLALSSQEHVGYENIREYEMWFVEFIEANYNTFTESGVDDIRIFIDVFYAGDQCNFEIFDNILLQRLTIFKISFPVSVYKISLKKFKELISLAKK
jgi:hypothetical protein